MTNLLDYVIAEVRAEMARQRMNQRQLAKVLGISQAQTSKRMIGRIAFNVNELEQIARALRVPVTQFLPALDPGLRSIALTEEFGRERSAA